MKKHNFWLGIWDFEIKDKDGNLVEKWSQQNALADEGESLLLDSFFRGQNSPTGGFYVRLFNDTPAETDSLADLTGEPSGNGYSASALAQDTTDFPTLELDSGDYRVVSKSVVFTSTGTIGPVTYAVLATSTDNSGKLIAYVALSESRTLANNETLTITITIKLQ